MKIAIQGELGSFSHQAAETMLPGAKIVPCARSLEVFDRVGKGTVGGAVIPIENSLAGSVAEHFDLLLSREVHIVSEFRLRIVHNLIAAPGVKFGDIRKVYSHPIAIEQCRDLFAKYPKLEPTPFYDTAGSVKHVVGNGLRDAAGIASRRAAEVYAGKILKAGIEDDKKNFTRFFSIHRGLAQGGRSRASRKAGKTSLAFVVRNIPGALFKALSVFALRDISLTKIESRPMRGRPWEYVFFVDLLRGDDEAARNALHHLGEVAELVKVLGIYPPA
ncbi:MAG: prephenate dehydratase [Acidobacteria bacterium]|nr:prephenate dehydratase [Acidobacteriota bacterium]